jgi:hypothetical protein
LTVRAGIQILVLEVKFVLFYKLLILEYPKHRPKYSKANPNDFLSFSEKREKQQS